MKTIALYLSVSLIAIAAGFTANSLQSTNDSCFLNKTEKVILSYAIEEDPDSYYRCTTTQRQLIQPNLSTND